MTFILTSRLNTHIRDEEGNKIPVVIEDTNNILTNIKNNLKQTKRVVYVANDPNNFEENDIRAKVPFESLNMTGLVFDEKILLDNRNSKNAKEILTNADLIILCGGKCLCQKKFFDKIKLKKILKNYQGLIISISAGTMNLCKTVCNFPEELGDLKEPRYFKGLGIFDKIIIPHFDGETKTYQIPCEEVDVVNDYILPLSKGKEFLGLENDSYILINNDGTTEYYGNIYKISDGKVSKTDLSKESDEISL